MTNYYLLKAYDYPDENTRQKRSSFRDEHLRKIHRYRHDGLIIDAGALLDDDERIIGSLIIFQAETLQQIKSYLAEEPFVTENIWEEVDIRRYRPVRWDLPPSCVRELSTACRG